MTVGGMNVDNKMESIFRALGDYYRGHKAQTLALGGIDSAHGSVIHALQPFLLAYNMLRYFLSFQFSFVLLIF